MVRTYDPALNVLTFGGIPIGGYADGTFITAVRSSDSFVKSTGAQGETTRAKSNDRSGEITVTLQQSSPSNDVFSGFAQLDENSNTGIRPVMLKEINGTTKVGGAEAWVRKPSDVGRAKEVGNTEWIIDVANMDTFVGGIIA